MMIVQTREKRPKGPRTTFVRMTTTPGTTRKPTTMKLWRAGQTERKRPNLPSSVVKWRRWNGAGTPRVR